MGNNMTSLMFFAPHISIHSRSIPQPQPAVGGMPYSSASMKSISFLWSSVSCEELLVLNKLAYS